MSNFIPFVMIAIKKKKKKSYFNSKKYYNQINDKFPYCRFQLKAVLNVVFALFEF